MNAQALEAENDRLRKLLGLGASCEWGFVPAEALPEPRWSRTLVTTLTLTAGVNPGVKRYSPVVAPEGLVGTVLTAEPTMSIAILYTNPDFRASAMSADGSRSASSIRTRAATRSRRQYFLELRNVPYPRPYSRASRSSPPAWAACIRPASRSGRSSGSWRRIRVCRARPARSRRQSVEAHVGARADAEALSQGVGNIWTAAVSIDSATRSIVKGGDSLMIAAADLADRQRRATLDSAKRVAIDSVLRVIGVQRA